MEWRVGPDMTEVRVLCFPLKVNDGGGSVDYPTQYEPYFHSLGLGWKLSSFNPIVAAAKIR